MKPPQAEIVRVVNAAAPDLYVAMAKLEKGERVSEAAAAAARVFYQRYGVWPKVAFVLRMPLGTKGKLEVDVPIAVAPAPRGAGMGDADRKSAHPIEPMALIQCDWMPAGHVAVTVGRRISQCQE